MARTSLILRYQWRAYWRRFFQLGRAKFYFSVLALLAWFFFVKLPGSLAEAASELAAGRTASMDAVLVVLCLLWLIVLGEDANVSLTARRLRRFPLDVRTLLAVRMLSMWCSPLTWLIAIGSLIGLLPLLSARHPLLGTLTGLVLFALTISLGVSLSHLLGVSAWRRRLLASSAVFTVAIAAFVLVQGPQRARDVGAGLIAASPTRLVTAASVAATPWAALMPAGTLAVSAVPIFYLLLWSFRGNLHQQAAHRATRRAAGIVRVPGRLGGLAQKEQRDLRGVLDLWPGLFLVLAASAVSIAVPLSPTVRQSIVAMVCVLNLNVTLNVFGLERPGTLTRYSILPIRGRDVLLAKNIALAIVVAVQVSLLMAIGLWQSGPVQFGADITVAAVLLFSHLAWGNAVSVFEPIKMYPSRFAPGPDPVTGLVSVFMSSLPGLAVMVLLRIGSPMAAGGIAGIVLVVMAAYYGSLHYAGKSVERRIHVIARRLA